MILTDGSESATAAVDHEIAIAELFDANVHTRSVVDLSAVAGAYDVISGPDLLDSLEEGCERAVAVVEDDLENNVVDIVTEVGMDRPVSHAISSAA